MHGGRVVRVPRNRMTERGSGLEVVPDGQSEVVADVLGVIAPDDRSSVRFKVIPFAIPLGQQAAKVREAIEPQCMADGLQFVEDFGGDFAQLPISPHGRRAEGTGDRGLDRGVAKVNQLPSLVEAGEVKQLTFDLLLDQDRKADGCGTELLQLILGAAFIHPLAGAGSIHLHQQGVAQRPAAVGQIVRMMCNAKRGRVNPVGVHGLGQADLGVEMTEMLNAADGEQLELQRIGDVGAEDEADGCVVRRDDQVIGLLNGVQGSGQERGGTGHVVQSDGLPGPYGQGAARDDIHLETRPDQHAGNRLHEAYVFAKQQSLIDTRGTGHEQAFTFPMPRAGKHAGPSVGVGVNVMRRRRRARTSPWSC